jgi:hypothetical protein
VELIDDEGWIKLHRKILDNPIFKDSEALQLFLYCLLRANFKPNDFLFNGQVVHLDRGQFIFGLRKASKALKMSIKKLRNRLLILGKLGITAHQTTHRFSIITVCNYNHYQDIQNGKGHSKGHSEGTLRATNKNVKNEKNKNGRSKDADPRVKEFLNYWGETFTQKTGQPYTFSFAKEGNLVKQLLQVHPLETLQEMTNAFFRDEQSQRRGLTIGIFYQEINRLIGLKEMNPLEQAKRELTQRRVTDTRAQPRNPIEKLEDILEEEKTE